MESLVVRVDVGLEKVMFLWVGGSVVVYKDEREFLF